jgi:ketosteroid isomerase-like protein
MKRIATVFFAGLIVLTASFSAHAVDGDEAQIRAAEERWVAASSSGDRATLAQLLDDGFRDTTPAGVQRSKAQVLAAAPLPIGSRQTLADVEVKVSGDMATVTGKNRFIAGPGAQAVDYHFTDVFVRRGEGWRALSSQSTRE